MKRTLLAAFLAFRFVLELMYLAAFGVWATAQPLRPPTPYLLAVAVVAAAALVWGVFVSPKAGVKLPENGRLTVELCIVLLAVLALRAAHRPQLALALGAAGVAVAVLNAMLRRADTRLSATMPP